MRLAVLIHSMHGGGAERVTSHLANAWAQRGWEVTIITFAASQPDFYPIHGAVKRIALNLASDSENLLRGISANLRRTSRLRSVLRDTRPDVLIAMMTTAAVTSILATRGLGCRVLVSERIHPKMMPLSWPWSTLRRVTYPLAQQVVMLSKQGLRWLETHIPGASGVVIPNPIPFPLAVSQPVIMPDSICAPLRKILLAAGRLDKQKGFSSLLEAFAELQPDCPHWDLVILGEGPERPALEAHAAALGVAARVRFPGLVGNIGDWYTRADLYVMSSKFEGFPNSLAEAMAHGCAAVSYDCDTGPSDIIEHEQSGLLVAPVGDVKALRQALNRMMSNDDERQLMATRALRVRQQFSMERVLGMWDDLILGRAQRGV
jgi:glycosyltransferase involved in cell wall biosynthesis